MSRAKRTRANFTQGKAVAERENPDGWGGPDTGASPLPLDQHHTRRATVGYGEVPPDTRRQPALAGDELARIVTNVSAPQLVHGATTRPRGMPGKRDAADGTPRATGRIKAVIKHGGYGLGPLVTRPADLGHDPGAEASARGIDYRHQTAGPGSGYLSQYVDAARHVPAPTSYGSGYPRLPRYHQLSRQVCMGEDLYAPFDQRGR